MPRAMQGNGPKFLLEVDGVPKPIFSAEDLRREISLAVEASVHALSLNYEKGTPPKRWETIVYPLLGLKVPQDTISLSMYPFGSDALVSYEEEEVEWVPEGADRSRTDKIEFKTAAGELFIESGSEVVPVSVAMQLMEEFYAKRKKPSLLQWRRTN